MLPSTDPFTPARASIDAADPLQVSVAQLLAASRAAHARYRADAASRNYPLLDSHIRQARDLRHEAETLDPERRVSAWTDDRAVMKGQSSDTLMAFYERYLVTP